MAKYKIWDKKSDIYTLVKSPDSDKMHWTAQEYINEEAPWAGQPNAKVIISGGAANGAFFLDFDERVEFYKQQGANITGFMSDDEVLAAMEYFDTHQPLPEPLPEERIAAAVEFLSLLSM